MAISDAIIISLVGMGVVFCGLLLTSWLISVIALVPAWLERRRQAVPPPFVPVAKETVQPLITPVPLPDMAAVIVVLLEVEMRLHGGDRPSRFTFRRDPQAQAWSGDGGGRDNRAVIRGVR